MKRFVTSILLMAVLVPLASCAGRFSQNYIKNVSSPVSSYAVLKDYRTARVSSEDRPGNLDFRPIEPGETLLVAGIEGPAEITHIWCTISSPENMHLRKLVLRIYYDGNEFPSVESPIGDFMGLGHGRYYDFENTTQAIGTINGMNCFWPMPFRKSARIELTNEGEQRVNAFYYYVDYKEFDRMPQNLAYFHAQYRQDFPAPDKQPYLILDTEGGQGHFMGTNISIHTQVEGWWGEGDDIFTIDGEERASLWGTGSEDYFCGAWCYGDTFHNDYFGMPLREKKDQSEDNYWNVYRYHIENPVTFNESLKVEIEHGRGGYDNTRAGGWNNDYSSVAYWYMEKPVRLKGELPPMEKRLPKFRKRTSPDNIIDNIDFEYSPGTDEINVHTQGMDRWDGDWLFEEQAFAGKNQDETSATLTFQTMEHLRGEAVLAVTQAPDYGKIRIYLNDKILIEEFDAYQPEVRSAIIKIGNIDLPRNKYRLRVETIGKNAKSTNYLWGIDYFRVGGEAPEFESNQPVIELNQ